MSFRYSTISDFHKCQRYYDLKHNKGHSDGMERLGDLAFGTAVHLGVQDILEGSDGVDVFTTLWEMEKARDLEYGRLSHDVLAKLGVDLLTIFREEHASKFTPSRLEQKLATKMGGHAFSGTVDFLGSYKGIESVVDWKTAAYPYDQYKIVVNEQMYGYAHLAKSALGFNAEQVVYGVAVKDPANPRWQFKVAALTDEKLEKVVDNITQTCNAISTTKQFLRNPSQCVVGKRVCPFYSLCHGSAEERPAKDGGEEKT